jgi:PAS domain S-box-containing protein
VIARNGVRDTLNSVSSMTSAPTGRLGAHFARVIVELAPDAILVVDQAGRIELANRCAEDMFGYGRDTLLGLGVEALIPARLGAAHRAHRSDYAASPTSRPMDGGLDLWARRADGREFPVEISLSPITLGDGTRVVVTVHDASQRQANERALRDRLGLAEDRTSSAADLHQFVIDRLFTAGLGIASVAGHVASDQAERLGVVADELDRAIQTIRTVTLDAAAPPHTPYSRPSPGPGGVPANRLLGDLSDGQPEPICVD